MIFLISSISLAVDSNFDFMSFISFDNFFSDEFSSVEKLIPIVRNSTIKLRIKGQNRSHSPKKLRIHNTIKNPQAQIIVIFLISNVIHLFLK